MASNASKKDIGELMFKVEGILFSYGDWLNVDDIVKILDIDSAKIVLEVLAEVRKKFENGFSFFVEENEQGMWRMVLRSEYEELVSELVSEVEMPANVIKVLSVIAYEMPVSKTRLSEIMGKHVKQEIDFLIKTKFLYSEKKGNGRYYKVTKKFYDYFKLDESTDFRNKANKEIKSFLEEPIPLKDLKEKKKLERDEVKSQKLEFESNENIN